MLQVFRLIARRPVLSGVAVILPEIVLYGLGPAAESVLLAGLGPGLSVGVCMLLTPKYLEDLGQHSRLEPAAHWRASMILTLLILPGIALFTAVGQNVAGGAPAVHLGGLILVLGCCMAVTSSLIQVPSCVAMGTPLPRAFTESYCRMRGLRITYVAVLLCILLCTTPLVMLSIYHASPWIRFAISVTTRLQALPLPAVFFAVAAQPRLARCASPTL